MLFDDKLLLKVLCIPINLSNTHWILIHLDLKNSTFFPINPYHPQNPSIRNTNRRRNGTKNLTAIWTSRTCTQKPRLPPLFTHTTSIGFHKLWSLCLLVHGHMRLRLIFKNNVGHLLPATIDQCRFLILSWMLRGEIFFLP